MKKYIQYLFFFFTASFLFTACVEKEVITDHSTTFSAFEYTTADLQLKIDTAIKTPVILEWERSKAADYSAVFYEVLFVPENGDFAAPVYTQIPDKFGANNFISLSQQDLNVIAERLGIKSLETGKIKWKVKASNGISYLLNNDHRTITVERPIGFAESPTAVYLLGSATSAGDSIKKAIPLKNLGNGVYEIFTDLSDGKYHFIEKLTGRTRHFAITGNALVEENVNNSPIEANKIHRLRLDFKNQLAKATVINKVSLWYSGTNSILGNDFTQENPLIPIWTMQTKLELVNGTNGLLDYRYKFRTEEKDAEGTVSTVFWGSEKISLAQQSATTDAAYFYLYEVNSSQSDYCYKFSREGQNGKNLKFKMDLQSTISNYTHSLSVVE